MLHYADLKRGDIVIISLNGKPYHAAIFSPNEGQEGDLVHMGYGLKRAGAIRSTLEQTIKSHQEMNHLAKHLHPFKKINDIEIKVIRSKKINSDDIADIAESWLHQGVIYDEKRLANTLQHATKNNEPTEDEITVNVFEYLKYAARRETAPIKTPVFPYTVASFKSALGFILTFPAFDLPQSLVNYGNSLINQEIAGGDLPKGFTCAGFVLACIGAAALKDEIYAVTPETGWISLKHGKDPRGSSGSYFDAWLRVKKELDVQEELQNKPGLHALLTEEQIKNFNIKGLVEKLTPFVARLNPHHPSLEAFNQGFETDAENWENLGLLPNEISSPMTVSKDKPFDKEKYRRENQQIRKEIDENREQFAKTFGQEAFKNLHYRSTNTLFNRFVNYWTNETPRNITQESRATGLNRK